MRTSIKSWLCFVVLLCFLRCFAVNNYFSGQVLKPWQVALSPGWNSMFWYLPDAGDRKFYVGVLPSFGGYIGLPWRLELGTRYTVPWFVDGVLRWQINPPAWKLVDVSLNYHVGAWLNDEDYDDIVCEKYGVTISRQIACWQPYFNLSKWGSLMFLRNNDSSHSTLVSFGFAYTNKRGDLIFPEVTAFLDRNDDFPRIWMFGFGLRLPLNKK